MHLSHPTSTGDPGRSAWCAGTEGKLDGVSIRVPTPNVSVVDLKFVAKRKTTVQEINDALIAASQGRLKGILAVTHHPNVSIDFNHDPHSSTVALDQTKVMDGDFVAALSWYDNEWASRTAWRIPPSARLSPDGSPFCFVPPFVSARPRPGVYCGNLSLKIAILRRIACIALSSPPCLKAGTTLISWLTQGHAQDGPGILCRNADPTAALLAAAFSI